MHEHENINIVRTFLEGYARRDAERMLGTLADDVEWRMPGSAGVVPWLGHHLGRNAVATMFQSIGANEDLVSFDEHDVLAKGDVVVVLGHERTRVKSTNKACDLDIVLTFDIVGGKVVEAQAYFDPALVEAAYRPAVEKPLVATTP